MFGKFSINNTDSEYDSEYDAEYDSEPGNQPLPEQYEKLF